MTTFSLMRRLLLLATLCAPLLARAENPPPDVLVRNTTIEVTTILKRDKADLSNNRQKLYALIDAKVLPHFDFNQMTQLAVGRYWRQANATQQRALVTQFRTLLVRTYAGALAAFNNQTIEFKPFNMPQGSTDVTVETQVKQPGAQPIPINYSMEQTGDGWKVYDVSIDGVSLVTNYRGSFGTEIRREGIDGLLRTLTARNQQDTAATAAVK
ncbi:MAG: ABC transporter substrate-binding protein [Betaproteobacteria bacterium]|nr:ABC transporter substrate-binding protein [Betaproteobacteria bacterium]